MRQGFVFGDGLLLCEYALAAGFVASCLSCGNAFVYHQEIIRLMIGETVSHYTILEKLGEGGMGVVYKARDSKLNRIVALKFLPHNLLPTEADHARFLREAQAAAQLNHANVCTIHSIEEWNGQTFLVMEYVEGETLRRRIETSPLKISDVLLFAVKLLRRCRKHLNEASSIAISNLRTFLSTRTIS